MGLLSSMLTGGAAGGFQAYGQVKDEEIKAAREAEKEAALTARMENMARLQREYQTSERLADQAFKTRNEARDMAAENSLAGALRGDNQDLGGDAYSVKADANDFKGTMNAKGLLALEEREYRKEDRQTQEADRQYKKDRDIITDQLARERIEAMKGRGTSNELKDNELYNRAYTTMFAKYIAAGMDDAEADEKAHEYASSVSGMDLSNSENNNAPKQGKDGKMYIKKGDGWYRVDEDKPEKPKPAAKTPPPPQPQLTEAEKRENTAWMIEENKLKSQNAYNSGIDKIGNAWSKLRKIGNRSE